MESDIYGALKQNRDNRWKIETLELGVFKFALNYNGYYWLEGGVFLSVLP